jgi:hypothetical protein
MAVVSSKLYGQWVTLRVSNFGTPMANIWGKLGNIRSLETFDGGHKQRLIFDQSKCRMVGTPINTGTSAGGSNTSKWTPPKGRKSKSDIKPTPKGLPGWYLRSCLLDGGIEGIFITTASMTEDAYYDPLVKALLEPEGQGDIKSIGLLGAHYMRCSLTSTERLMNYRRGNRVGDYQRRVFIRVIDEGEESVEKRLEALKIVKAFLEHPDHNKYNTKVYIQEPGWDMSTGQEPRKVDHFVEYKEIVKIIMALYNGVDAQWAQGNMEAANCYFTEGHIPFEAHAQLGFPIEAVQEEIVLFALPSAVSTGSAEEAVVEEEVGETIAASEQIETAQEVPVAVMEVVQEVPAIAMEEALTNQVEPKKRSGTVRRQR